MPYFCEEPVIVMAGAGQAGSGTRRMARRIIIVTITGGKETGQGMGDGKATSKKKRTPDECA